RAAADERIQAKPAVRTAGRRDDEDAPRRGKKPIGTGTYVAGGAVAGLVILVLGGVGIWAFSGGDNKPKEDAGLVTPPPPPVADLTGSKPKVAPKAEEDPAA